MNNYLKCERETIIRFDDESGEAIVSTFQRHIQRRLEDLAKSRPDEVTIKRTYSDEDGIIVTVPKSWVKVRPLRQVSEVNRKAASERLKAHRINSKVV